jgi:hypothetical protein
MASNMNSVTISFALFTKDSFFCMVFLRYQQIYLLVTCRFRFREFMLKQGVHEQPEFHELEPISNEESL